MDYALNIHYDSDETYSEIWEHGYTIAFLSSRVIDFVFKRYGIVAECKKVYRFEDEKLFSSIRDDLRSEDFIGTFGDDGWPLYAHKKKDYWETLFGVGYLEKTYPLIGKALWDSLSDLVVVRNIVL